MKSFVVSAKHFKPNNKTNIYNKLVTIKNNAILFLLCIMFLFGTSIGAVSANSTDTDTLKILDFLFLTNFKARVEQSMVYTFSADLSSSFIFLLTVFILGLTLWGFLIIPIVAFFRGYGLGLSIGYIYGTYKIKGILFNVLVMLPGAIIISVAIILFSKLSIYFSFKLSKGAFIKKSLNQVFIKDYIIKFAFFLIIIALGSAVDMIFTAIFLNLFSF